MAFGATDLKKGVIFQLDGVPYRVVEYGQKVMGRGSSVISIKMKSLLDDKVLERTFRGGEGIQPAEVTYSTVQYLYNDGTIYYFMDNDDFSQYELPLTDLEGQTGYIKEGDSVSLQLFDGRVIGVELPKNVQLKVAYTEEVTRGDTANAVQKDAELETGLRVRVPSFIKTGDLVSVDTATGNYRERVK